MLLTRPQTIFGVHARQLQACTIEEGLQSTWDVIVCDGVSLGKQRSGGLSDECGRIQVASARAKLHGRQQRELWATM